MKIRLLVEIITDKFREICSLFLALIQILQKKTIIVPIKVR